MFLSTNKCHGLGECVKKCPTDAIRIVNNKAFSCIVCGTCYENCPNHAISKNKYGGYIVDRAKCNGCGICKFNCPTNNIKITEDGIVKGICSRCGICASSCPENARIDGLELIKDKQINYLKSLDLALPSYNMEAQVTDKKVVTRASLSTDLDKCILCGRCQYYCPTNAISVKVDQDIGICTDCKVCEDVCPTQSIKKGIINHETCTLCLNCLKHCPKDAILLDNFQLNINKLNQENSGSIVSCLNCHLCVENSKSDGLKVENNKLRYDPTVDINGNLNEVYEDSIKNCPVSTLELIETYIPYKNTVQYTSLSGFCTTCGKCIDVCLEDARIFDEITWDGKASDECISCGTCAEFCPKDAITIKRNGINVNLDKCILCETCAVYCPRDAIEKSTLAKKSIINGFNEIDDKFCINCKLCYEVCPEDAIIDNGDSMGVNQDKCIYCGGCANVCPSKAFIFEREFVNLNQSTNGD